MNGYTLVLCQAEGCARARRGDHPTAHPADRPESPGGRPDSPSIQPDSSAALPDAPGGRRDPSRTRGPVEQVLSDATRHSEHGILVVTGCLLGQLLCQACGPSAPAATGRVAMVQPCHASRQPSGPAVLVGPIRDTADATALCRWLRAGTLTADRLPDRLREYARTLRRASAN
ncbi:MAG TPA: hypothetical protein VK735_44570 [Pseudonocardia sp.]|jgi:hypothetical protein|uniref:hypothetical protein n=1 Tax=Pseudonocardia sp. TaxID=60912 RepID=UPI002BD66958|nr:hypothetical protein [Pseudonocardia sp.]HTF54560.1 hypothetical protein [Pseudonocardia sp.]